MIPPLKISSQEGSEGICPNFQVFDFTNGKNNIIYTSERVGEEVRIIPVAQKSFDFHVDKVVCGDILVSFTHVTPLYGVKKMFHLAFHTGMVGEDLILNFSKSQLETACKNEIIPNTFKVTLYFSHLTEGRGLDPKYKILKEDEQNLLSELIDRRSKDPSICFFEFGPEIFEAVHDLGNPTMGTISEKGGYMHLGLSVHNPRWKRKWFVLKSINNTLSYYKNPRDSAAQGVITLSSIQQIEARLDIEEIDHCFVLKTNKGNILLRGETEIEQGQWVAGIRYASELAKKAEAPLFHSHSLPHPLHRQLSPLRPSSSNSLGPSPKTP